MSEEEIFTGFSAGSMYNDPQFLEGRHTKKLGETHMTGGGNAFYEKLGFGKGWHWNCYGR